MALRCLFHRLARTALRCTHHLRSVVQFVTTELTPLDGEESAQTLSVLDIDG